MIEFGWAERRFGSRCAVRAVGLAGSSVGSFIHSEMLGGLTWMLADVGIGEKPSADDAAHQEPWVVLPLGGVGDDRRVETTN